MGLQIARIAPLRKVPPHVSPIKANLLCLLSMLAWAAGLPAAEYLIEAIPPLPRTAIRMVLAALLLLPLWWWQEGAGTIRRAPWVRGILIGFRRACCNGGLGAGPWRNHSLYIPSRMPDGT